MGAAPGGTCRFFGRRVPARHCEPDHTVARADGGGTSEDDLAALCTGHHTIKHSGSWSLRHDPSSAGTLVWTTPGGRETRTRPALRVGALVE